MPMLSRSSMASTFSWWWSLSSCFCANLWISLDTTSTSRCLWRSLFLMYRGALKMFRSTLFWNRCIMSILLWRNPTVGYRMYKQVSVFVCIAVVCYEGTVRSSFLSTNTLETVIWIYVRKGAFFYIFFFTLLIKHAPSLESNTTCCELVGNAGPAPVRLLSLHFLYIVS